MKKMLQLIMAVCMLPLTMTAQDSSSKVIVERYFNAFNQSDYAVLRKVITDDFMMQEGDFRICSSADEFYTVFQWDSIFKPQYTVKDIQIGDGKIIVDVSKLDIRVGFLHDDPMETLVEVKMENQRVKSLTVLSYSHFDGEKWGGRLKNLTDWINQYHAQLNGFERDLTPEGARRFLKAIDLFTHRTLQDKEHIFIDKDLQLQHIVDSIFVHISWHKSPKGYRFPSNGLIIVKNGEAIMVDSPFTNEKTERLYNYLKNKMGIKVTQQIAGHFHADCMGGIAFLHEKGVYTIAGSLTCKTCKQKDMIVPKESFKGKKEYTFNGKKVVCQFLGGGHSFDNIVVWLPEDQILFGGCMVKNIKATGMGNLSDATVDEWDDTLVKLQEVFPSAKWVIPGHGEIGGKELIAHTIDLVVNYNAQKDAQ